jgi:D-tyrosyl-tRNA(Tyr) deacylase
VLGASVTVDKQLISSVGKGILVFAAVANGDTEKDVDALAAKVLKMKLWDDEAGGRVRQTLLPIFISPSNRATVEEERTGYPRGDSLW